MELPTFLNQTQAARALGVDRVIIQRAEKRGQIEGFLYGNQRLYRRSDIVGLYEQRKQK